MIINCPHCGPRCASEFTYFGDATPRRPTLMANGDAPADADIDAVHDYVFIRENRAGHMHELWYHGFGCRAWIEVSRNTVTHEVLGARLAKGRPQSHATAPTPAEGAR